MPRFLGLVLLGLLGYSHNLYAEPASKETLKFYMIQFERGPAWVDGIRYEKQPQIEPHLAYWKALYYREVLLMSGPWQDESGGMLIVRSKNLPMTEQLVKEDPAISTGLIRATIQEWRVLSSAMRSVKPQRIEVKPDDSFRVERLDPDSPIRLRRN